MAFRWASTALAVALLSLLLLSNNATADAGQDVDVVAKVNENTVAADPLIRLPSDRSVTAEEGLNSVEAESVPIFRSEADHQEAGDGSSTAETTTLETADPADAIPSLKVSLIPIRRGDGDGDGLPRVHLRGTRGFFWFMRPRHHHHHHSHLFHQLFLDGRQPDAAQPEMEVHLDDHHRAAQLILRRGIQLQLPMEMEQEQGDQQEQQQVPRVLAFRIRRLGPHHHHSGMMHDCAWRKRLETLAAAQGVPKPEEDKAQEEGFAGLVKRFTVFLNPQLN